METPGLPVSYFDNRRAPADARVFRTRRTVIESWRFNLRRSEGAVERPFELPNSLAGEVILLIEKLRELIGTAPVAD